MHCIVCGSRNIVKKPTKISDFLVARIMGEDQAMTTHTINLCHCKDCTFSFYDRRLTDEESARLYEGYREEIYQKTREKYDCWYTDKVNNALNNDEKALSEQKRVIDQLVSKNVPIDIKIALDYGGNKGESFTELIGTQEKYVYDISAVEPLGGGVETISDYNELFEHQFDLIMCNMTLEHVSYPRDFMKLLYDIGSAETYYYLEVPSEDPFEKDKFSLMKNIALLLNPYCSNIKLIKHYLYLRKQPYMPMSEHISFFTPKALSVLMEYSGFDIIDIQENDEQGVLGKGKVLSTVFKKRNLIV